MSLTLADIQTLALIKSTSANRLDPNLVFGSLVLIVLYIMWSAQMHLGFAKNNTLVEGFKSSYQPPSLHYVPYGSSLMLPSPY